MSGPAAGLVATHPEPGARPDEVRWVLAAGAAAVPDAPALDALVADGTLTGARCEPGALVTRLGPGRSWSAEGARVRSAVHAALAEGASTACATCPVAGPGCPAAAPGRRRAGTFDPRTLLRRR